MTLAIQFSKKIKGVYSFCHFYFRHIIFWSQQNVSISDVRRPRIHLVFLDISSTVKVC